MQKTIISALFILVFLFSCKLLDDTTSDGITDPDPTVADSLVLVQPVGGESIAEGSSYQIKWISNSSEAISIQFTFDNGFSWYILADSISNTGTFEWFPVPNQVSTQCKIRVTTKDATLSDISSESFSIIRNSNQALIVSDPNGQEEIEAGSQYPIKWFSSGIDSVKLEYTSDNGQHWSLIAVDKNNAGVYYWEPIPNAPSSLSRIRVMDAFDGVPSDQSDSTFSILPEPKIEVLNPNGGETWTVGSSQTIAWTSENIERVKIKYTTDNGFAWHQISGAESLASIGFFTWNSIPAVNSRLCKIRIYDADDDQPSDVSDETFTITDPISQEDITIVSPNGGEDFEAGTVQNIVWNSTGIDSVKLELSTNDGRTWNTLVARMDNTGGYQWQINTQLNSPLSRIRVSDLVDGDPADDSDSPFTISPIKSINVTYPTNGLVFTAGDPVNIQWESSGIEKVGIRYTYSNGIAHPPDIPDFVVMETSIANQGSYETSFSIPSSEYYVEVYDAKEGGPRSRNDGNFKITPQIFPEITVKAPNGGEEFLTSDPQNTYSHEILWESKEVESVRIQYSLNGGANWITIVNNMPSSGIYTWVMPQDVAFRSENARIRVSSAADTTFYDDSDEVFAIHPQAKLMRIIYPNGAEGEAEVLEPKQPGDPVPAITWHSAGIYRVKVELSLDNGMTWEVLAADMQSTGALGFTFIYSPSTNARVRITDVGPDASPTSPVNDISDHTFYYRVEKGG
ncbi:MAG: hypothetical protein KKA84_06685 [Bacteroidetes bacterium]|nr:hypothetical protein [Bacteroidota bacterium]